MVEKCLFLSKIKMYFGVVFFDDVAKTKESSKKILAGIG